MFLKMSQNLTNIYIQGKIKIKVLHIMQKLQEGASHVINFVLQSNKVLVYTSFTIKVPHFFSQWFHLPPLAHPPEIEGGHHGKYKRITKATPPPTLWSNAFFWSLITASLIVRRLCAEYYMNCALWTKSMKFGVLVGFFMLISIWYGATVKMYLAGCYRGVSNMAAILTGSRMQNYRRLSEED